ncbi:hypothetical protein BLNAU_10363 [Blattamonas nauphoetae]|uniref:Uncharacterized protein n=1 Tax=Blattamonas nauphoetae TaxID=2049346 RepID=A0ABQ9XTA1_9EUKA|nr:hypothetical protein BLNAU_10363 [Blattamonas nauphoetae]
MGNQSPYPQFVFPYEQPSDDTLKTYLRHCTLRHPTNIQYSFDTNHKGKIVEWEGMVTHLTKDKIQFAMNPTESTSTRYDLTVSFTPDVFSTYPTFKVGEAATFRAKLEEIAYRRSNKLRLVTRTPNNPTIQFSWMDFLLYYGRSAQTYPVDYFHKYYENRPIYLTGRFKSIDEKEKQNDQKTGVYRTAEFESTEDCGPIKAEPIQMRVFLSDLSTVAGVERLSSSAQVVTVAAKFLKRKVKCHQFQLYFIVPYPYPIPQDPQQQRAPPQQSPNQPTQLQQSQAQVPQPQPQSPNYPTIPAAAYQPYNPGSQYPVNSGAGQQYPSNLPPPPPQEVEQIPHNLPSWGIAPDTYTAPSSVYTGKDEDMSLSHSTIQPPRQSPTGMNYYSQANPAPQGPTYPTH